MTLAGSSKRSGKKSRGGREDFLVLLQSNSWYTCMFVQFTVLSILVDLLVSKTAVFYILKIGPGRKCNFKPSPSLAELNNSCDTTVEMPARAQTELASFSGKS